MPTADEAVITGDRAFGVWEIERLHLGWFSTFVERQMKMRAGVVEGAVAVGSANDNDIVILEIENPSFVGLKLVLGKCANPPPAGMTDGFTGLPGVQFSVAFGL